MNNFNFYNPTKIIFGKGEIQKLSEEIKQDSKVMILYGGGSIKKNGVYDQVIDSLKNYQVIEFGGIPPNPEYSVLMEALKMIKEENVDFLLAVGGGSVIDGVKFLSSALLYEGEDPWDILVNRIPTQEGFPFGCVLTLPATGSEMNSGAVVSRSERKEKLTMGGPGLFPKFSILDPTVITSIPKKQIANGLADSFTHALEQYMTYSIGANLQDKLAESVLSSIMEVAPKILSNQKDYNAQSEFMWSCTMALNGLIQKGVPTDWAIHAMGHELTALHGIDHARTLAILAKSHYTYNKESKKSKLIQFGKNVLNFVGENDDVIVNKTIDAIDAFYNSLEIETKLSAYTDKYEGTAEEVQKRFIDRSWTGIGEHGTLNPDDIKNIVKMAY